MQDPKYLFVYGTLRRAFGGPAHALLASQSEFVAMGCIRGKLYDLGSYPGARWLPGASATIRGEIYLLFDPEITLATLDNYEGFTGLTPLFKREQVLALADDGGKFRVHVYTYARKVPESFLIESGDYVEFLNEYAVSS